MLQERGDEYGGSPGGIGLWSGAASWLRGETCTYRDTDSVRKAPVFVSKMLDRANREAARSPTRRTLVVKKTICAMRTRSLNKKTVFLRSVFTRAISRSKPHDKYATISYVKPRRRVPRKVRRAWRRVLSASQVSVLVTYYWSK